MILGSGSWPKSVPEPDDSHRTRAGAHLLHLHGTAKITCAQSLLLQAAAASEVLPLPETRMFRKLIRQACTRQLKRQGLAVIEPKFSVPYLREYAFEIATLLDIGVYNGTPVLYELYPDKRTVLIDPMPDVPARCRQWLDDPQRDMVFLRYAVGSTEADTELTLTRSTTSLLARHDKPDRPSDGVVRARVRRLDDILRDHGISGPFGLKIDTEGYELEVIRGADETLRSTAFVIAEVSIRNRFVGGYTFAEFVGEMDSRGFAVADILTLPGHSRHTDLLFVPKGSPTLDRFDLGKAWKNRRA